MNPKNRIYTWIGFSAGIGNRILALASVQSLCQILNIQIRAEWEVSRQMNASFDQLFKPMQEIIIGHSRKIEFGKNQWDPIEIKNDFSEFFKSEIDDTEFFNLLIANIRTLEFSKHIQIKSDELLAALKDGSKIAIHIRRTDQVLHIRKAFRKLTRNEDFRNNLAIIQACGIWKAILYSCFHKRIFKTVVF